MTGTGMIDGGGPSLAPSRALERRTSPGVYGAQLGPTWLGVRQGPPLGLMEIGLLTRPPMPEGDRWHELDCEGYARQMVQLEQAGADRFISTTGAVFDLAAQHIADVRHAGIFVGDQLLYFGALLLTQSSGQSGIHLPPRSIQVKFRRWRRGHETSS